MDEQSKPLRILIVDDHAVVRRGLQSVLADEPGLEVVGEAASGRESVFKARALQPDVVLMDIRMGEGDDSSGIDACRDIQRAGRLLPARNIDGSDFHGRVPVGGLGSDQGWREKENHRGCEAGQHSHRIFSRA